jgi:hypothetical protein
VATGAQNPRLLVAEIIKQIEAIRSL